MYLQTAVPLPLPPLASFSPLKFPLCIPPRPLPPLIPLPPRIGALSKFGPSGSPEGGPLIGWDGPIGPPPYPPGLPSLIGAFGPSLRFIIPCGAPIGWSLIIGLSGSKLPG